MCEAKSIGATYTQIVKHFSPKKANDGLWTRRVRLLFYSAQLHFLSTVETLFFLLYRPLVK